MDTQALPEEKPAEAPPPPAEVKLNNVFNTFIVELLYILKVILFLLKTLQLRLLPPNLLPSLQRPLSLLLP